MGEERPRAALHLEGQKMMSVQVQERRRSSDLSARRCCSKALTALRWFLTRCTMRRRMGDSLSIGNRAMPRAMASPVHIVLNWAAGMAD